MVVNECCKKMNIYLLCHNSSNKYKTFCRAEFYLILSCDGLTDKAVILKDQILISISENRFKFSNNYLCGKTIIMQYQGAIIG